MTRNNFWQVVGEIDSDSKPGVLHLIKRRTTTGALSCDCTAFRFARGVKTCKHVVAYEAVTLRSEIREVMKTPVIETHYIAPPAPTFITQGMSRPGVRRLRLRE